MRYTIIIVMLFQALITCVVDHPTYPTKIIPGILEPNQTSQIKWGNRELLVKWQGVESDTVSLVLFYYQTPFLTLAENVLNVDSAIVLLPFMNQFATGAHYSISLIGHELPIFSEPFNIRAWDIPELHPVRELSIGTEYLYQFAYISGNTKEYFSYRVERDTVVNGKTYHIQCLNGSVNPYTLLRVDSSSYYELYWDGTEREIYNVHWDGYVDENRFVKQIQNLDVLGNRVAGFRVNESYTGGFESSKFANEIYPGLGSVVLDMGSWYASRYLIAIKHDGVYYGDTTRYPKYWKRQ